MTTRGLRVGGDVGWGGAGGRGRGLSLLHLLFLAQTYLRQSKRCVCCQHCSLDVFVNNANIYIFFHLFFFWPCSAVCGILVPWAGIKPDWMTFIFTFIPISSKRKLHLLLQNWYIGLHCLSYQHKIFSFFLTSFIPTFKHPDLLILLPFSLLCFLPFAVVWVWVCHFCWFFPLSFILRIYWMCAIVLLLYQSESVRKSPLMSVSYMWKFQIA